MDYFWQAAVVLMAAVIFIEAFCSPCRQRRRWTPHIGVVIGLGLIIGLIVDTPWPLMSGVVGLLAGNLLTTAGYELGRRRAG